MNKNEMGIYIHIPFCVRKCEYCDFLSFPATQQLRETYVQALTGEIRAWKKDGERWLKQAKYGHVSQECPKPEITEKTSRDLPVQSIFFGGGTPSVLEPEQIGRILETIREEFTVRKDAEITVECNPGTLSVEKLKKLKGYGVNRLSIGLQSSDERELKILGRIHDRRMFEESYQAARRAGFANVNVDLMSGLPGQSLADWERTLDYVLNLTPPPEHISAYSLIIEEGTPFFEKYAGEGAKLLPDEDTERAMYHRTRERLLAQGYERYEISNYAKEGYACSHNIGYWKRRPYLGFGLGAASCTDEVRWSNTSDPACYLQIYGQAENDALRNPEESGNDALEKPAEVGNDTPEKSAEAGGTIRTEAAVLTRREQIEETVFLGLRMTEGIDLQEFAETFHETFQDVFGTAVDELTAEGLAQITDGRFCLTQKGMDLEGYVEERLLC